MKWRVGKIDTGRIMFLGLFALALYAIADRSRVHEKSRYYRYKLRASHLMADMTEAIRERKEELGIPIDRVNDPNNTGIIGPELTLVTTDRGDLTAKLAATNPNFAAVMVDLLKDLNLKEGDTIGIGETGSLIGVNLAVYAAVQTLGLEPIIIVSIGASKWGATDPEFTWLDMVSVLKERELINFFPVAASLGGGNDIGRGLSPEGRRLLKEAIARNNVELIREKILENSIIRRMEIYEKAAIKCYINIGGGVASIGTSQTRRLIPTGISRFLRLINVPVRSVVVRMAEQGIPFIHLLDVIDIAEKYKLPIIPTPPPQIGEGEIFFREMYNVSTTILVLLGLTVLTFVLIRLDLGYYIRRKR